MKVKSFGCSYIFGSDLKDCNSGPPWPRGSRSTWPALLAQHVRGNKLDAGYECHARPGSGNFQITERILNHVAQHVARFNPASLAPTAMPPPVNQYGVFSDKLHGLMQDSKDDIFVIGWSWIDRFDHYKGTNAWQPWKTILPGEVDKLAQTYYKCLHTEYSDKLNSLINIKIVIDILIQHNVRFLMTFIDDLMFDQQFHTSPAVTHLQSCILPYMTTFEGKTFLEWSKQKGFAVSATRHPLEEAHRAAADYMITVFDKQNTSGLVLQARA